MLFAIEVDKESNRVIVNFDRQTGKMLVAVIEDMMEIGKTDHDNFSQQDGLESLILSKGDGQSSAQMLTLRMFADDDPLVKERKTRYPSYGGNLFYEANGLDFKKHK